MRSPLSRSQTPTPPRRAVGFFRSGCSSGCPIELDHSAYFGLAKFYLSQPFQPSTRATLEICSKIVNALFRCNRPAAMDQNQETQPIESLLLNEWEIKFLPFFHRNIHRCSKAWATTRRVWRNQLSILTPEKRSRMVVTSSPHRCQILWPTSMAALSGIPARRVLE